MYLSLLLWNSVRYLYLYHHKCCVSLLFVLVFGHFLRILRKTAVKKKTSPNIGESSFNPSVDLFYMLKRKFAYKILCDEWFLGDMSFWHSSYFFHFFNVPSLFSIFRVLTLEFQCNRYRMKAKCCMTCLTINLPLEKKYFWISCLFQKMTQKPNFYVCSSLHLLQKMHKISDWWHFL